jgi:ATP-dependent 26S proteasome regulatory subunit
MASPTTLPALGTKGVEVPKPEFLVRMNDDYRAKIAHVFVLNGNIFDFCDNSGNRHAINRTLAMEYDTNVKKDLLPGSKSDDEKGSRGLNAAQEAEFAKGTQSVLATYSMSQGLEFAHPKSKEAWIEFLQAYYGEAITQWREDWQNPGTFEGMIDILNKWFYASKEVVKNNKVARRTNSGTRKELKFTIMFLDADVLFPSGDVATMAGDRFPIVNVRQWARDEQIGDRNRVILMTRHMTDVHESIRGGMVGIASHTVSKPTLEDRETWLNNFDTSMKKRTENKPLTIGSNEVRSVNMAPDFTFHDFAVQAAGMSRRQMEDVCMKSWLSGEAIDFVSVRERKQRALQDEYEGIIDFFEPEYGFEQIGGHFNIKDYFNWNIIQPLRNGDRRLCSKGVLMTGPPGTGKTVIAKALAKEAKMNFMIGHLDKLFGGLVGETEKKTRKFLEAVESAAPVIVFLDELDSILSSGRSSAGDSGVSARVFNSLMTWLSDESRAGRVVVVSASNRPDLLDAALIRSGRFDAKIPALPPQKGDAVGRKQILGALCGKYKIKFAKEVAATEKEKDNGIGLLLHDTKRVWTGAEIEVVLKKALSLAYRNGKTAITVENWNQAFNHVIPNTQEVERMTLLSLLFVDDLEYCPEEWRSIAKDKKQIQTDLKSLGWEAEEED